MKDDLEKLMRELDGVKGFYFWLDKSEEKESELREEENNIIGRNIFEILLLKLIFSQGDHDIPPNGIHLSRTTFKITLINPRYQWKQSRK